MAVKAPSIKAGSKKVPGPKTKANFVLGSRPPSLRAPAPPKMDTRNYGKQPAMPQTGFGETGIPSTKPKSNFGK